MVLFAAGALEWSGVAALGLTLLFGWLRSRDRTEIIRLRDSESKCQAALHTLGERITAVMGFLGLHEHDVDG